MVTAPRYFGRPAFVDIPIDMKARLRFVEKFTIDKNGCWIWKAAKDRKGYGVFRYGDTVYWAHRFSMLLFTGKLRRGKEVHHNCRCPSCVNPSHLEFLSKRKNTADGNRNRKKPGFSQVKTDNRFTYIGVANGN